MRLKSEKHELPANPESLWEALGRLWKAVGGCGRLWGSLREDLVRLWEGFGEALGGLVRLWGGFGKAWRAFGRLWGGFGRL